MKLNAKAACQWLAVPLAAFAIAACGDDSSPATGPCDGGLAAPCEPTDGDGQGINAECGDGILDVSDTTVEQCDDGADNGDQSSACTSDCQNQECGDGERGAGEACDDGNTEDGDECQSDCALPTCGDGSVDDGEECDDGNEASDDGCSSSCLEESCGDGVVQATTEECDNGSDNGSEGDGCTDSCQDDECGDNHVGPGEDCDDGNTEDGDDCTAECGPVGCGNGIEEGNEECDDGNGNDRDGCLSSCTLAVCGDGEVQMGVEECDDQNGDDTDGCSNDCVSASCGDGIVQDGEACDEGADNGAPGSSCTANCGDTDCGNGVVEAGEECDDGNVSGSDSCLPSCLWNSCGDGEAYTTSTDDANPNPLEECDDDNNDNNDTCTNACMNAVCGDSIVGPTETCDEGANNGMAGGSCTEDCQDPNCGNGVVEAGEDCDDSNDDDTDSCVACQWNECGDGAPYLAATDPGNTNPVEECDDGDEVDGNTCTNACTDAVCGDMIVGPGEACDDGNATNGDGCNSCAGADCGNGVVDPGEDCDDGNPSDTDGCLQTCVWNSCGDGFTYLTADAANPNPVEECDDANGVFEDDCLPTCVDNVCGDGYRDLEDEIEECDLGALNGPGSTCTLACTTGQCGNGVLNPGEECDDANVNNTDSCLSTCVWNSCGDGAVYVAVTNNSNTNALEQCDDANDDNTDLCTTACNYNACGDTFLLADYESEPYEDPDGTGPMTASRGSFDDGLGAIIDFWNEGLPTEIRPTDFEEDSEECENPSPTGGCVSSDFDFDGIAECHIAMCGDGFVQAGVEECDENENTAAHDINTDGCLDTCEFNGCGDGWQYITVSAGNTNPLEQCDDMNANNADLCSNDCRDLTLASACGDGTINGNEECDNGAQNGAAGNPCSTTCQLTTCGNGSVQAPEQCDDGNGNDNDQCRNNCRWNVCGDGSVYTATGPGAVFNQPIEECDDGNSNNRDNCLATCADADCGDGFEWFLVEACDDGNVVDDDECTNLCGLPACGDGIIQDGEACDDGGTCDGGVFADQACAVDSDCIIDYGNCGNSCASGPNVGDSCTGAAGCLDTGNCSDTSICGGAGVVNAGTACTDGSECQFDCTFVCETAAGGVANTCDVDADCSYGGAVVPGACVGGDIVTVGLQGTCKPECNVDTDCFSGDQCINTGGNGVCDGGTDVGQTCNANADCPGAATECSSDTCDASSSAVGNTCTVDTDCDVPHACTGATTVCDNTGAGCDLDVQCPGGTCNGTTCVGGSRATLACNEDVECGNYADCVGQDADGCHNADPPTNDPTGDALCAISACGDGILDENEGCELNDDDEILVHGAAGPCPGAAGCPAAGVTCNVATCTLSSCGAQAAPQTGEECDDGNVSDTDSCTNRCREARCGDGIVQTGEQCDDGNGIETDQCTNVCLWNICGDGVRFDGTPNAQTGPQQLCDSADLVPNGQAGFNGNTMFTRGRDDGDGYDDQPSFCNSQCQVVCDGTAGTGAQTWKNNTACILAAEEYPLWPVVEGTSDNNLDDSTYTAYVLDWEDAELYCDSLGIDATLVKFTSTTDRDVANALGVALGAAQWWTGASDSYPEDTATPNTFVWLDDTSATSMFTTAPDLPGGGCAATDNAFVPAGALNDLGCGTDLPFFCEYVGPFPRSSAP
jgi:cysteine-rich repeat protein